MNPEQKYRSNWDKRSLIRSRPSRPAIDFNQSGVWFPRNKQPLLFLPAIQTLSSTDQQTISAYSLCKYLEDIISEEVHMVNAACKELAEGRLPIDYPEEIKLAAYTVIIDEYYHVYMTRDFLTQLSAVYPKSRHLALPVPDTCHSVATIKERLRPEYRSMFGLIASCIFETTIIHELSGFSQTDELHPAVRQYIQDHMLDEARHSIFFSDLLADTWHRLPSDYKTNIGQHLAEFIVLYLSAESEKKYSNEILKRFFTDQALIDESIQEAYRHFEITPETPTVARVLTIFKKTGIMDDPAAKNSFMARQLYI